VTRSLEAQARLEADSTESFDEYVAKFLAD